MKNLRLFLLALAVGSMTMFTACDAPATDEGTDGADTTIVADDAAGDVEDANTEAEDQAAPAEETTEVEATEGEATEGEATEGEEVETTEAE